MLDQFTLSDQATSAYGWIGLLGVFGVVLFLAGLIGVSRIDRRLKALILAALALRVIGAIMRYYVVWDVYQGRGDATTYYQVGVEYAERMWRGDFGMFDFNWQGKWWGTKFVFIPSGLVLALIGPTMLGEFIVFSLISFVGLVCFVLAFRLTTASTPSAGYARWIWLFPSLWYWPSSVGKDCIILFGLGVTVAAYVGVFRNFRWFGMAAGLCVIMAIRPQVAAVVALSMLIAEWVQAQDRRGLSQLLRTIVIVVSGVVFIRSAVAMVGVESLESDEFQSYFAAQSGRGIQGGSAIEVVGQGPLGIPLGFMNVLFRPFPWESTNFMMALSSAEIWLFWILAFYRRKQIMASLRGFRSNRLLAFALPFIVLYSASIGLLFANLGIIARQRIFLFPLLFLFFEAAWQQAPLAARAIRRVASEPPRSPVPREVL